MTQEIINVLFNTELGKQLNVIYTTSDDNLFIWPESAFQHIHNTQSKFSQNSANRSIFAWHRE